MNTSLRKSATQFNITIALTLYFLIMYIWKPKGYWAPADRRKILAVKKDNPDMDLRMVFQAPYNKINKNSKTTYAMWCEKHDIPWTAYHDIPIDWLT